MERMNPIIKRKRLFASTNNPCPRLSGLFESGWLLVCEVERRGIFCFAWQSGCFGAVFLLFINLASLHSRNDKAQRTKIQIKMGHWQQHINSHSMVGLSTSTMAVTQ